MNTKHTLYMRHDKDGNVRPEAMAAHTPGPWTTPNAYPYAIQVTSANGWICSLQVNKKNATEEQKANARLISAAPELLEALENAAKIINGMHMKTLPACFAPSLEMVNGINYAIKKARAV